MKKIDIEKIDIIQLAKLICNYNGQNGTEKQVSRLLKFYKNDKKLMLQFAKNRLK